MVLRGPFMSYDVIVPLSILSKDYTLDSRPFHKYNVQTHQLTLFLRKWSEWSECSEVKGIKKGIKKSAHLYMNGSMRVCLSVCVSVCPWEKGE